MTHNYMQLMTNTSAVKVGDEITFDDILDYMGRIKAVGKAGAVLAERNLFIDENFKVQEHGPNPRPIVPVPNN